MKVAVLFGGQSSEHPVSLMSAASVLNNLDPKYEKYMVGITAEGKWMHFTGSVDQLEGDRWADDPHNEEVILSTNPAHHGFYNLTRHQIDAVDVILPILHGRNGEDGTVQGLAQLAEIPTVSCSLTSCALTMDKEYTHMICQQAGIPMAKYRALRRHEATDLDRYYEMLVKELGLPMYVKPAREGSSFGAHKIRDRKEFDEYTADAFRYDDKILFEEFISGTEVGCGVLDRQRVGEVYEVVVDTDMYGYEEKYDGYKTNIYVPAKNLNKEQRDEVNRLGLKIAALMDCDVLARVDFFNSPKGLIFLEANLIPGFTSHSLYPAMFKAAGMSYTELLNELIDCALKKSR